MTLLNWIKYWRADQRRDEEGSPVGSLIGVASCIVLSFRFWLAPNLSARSGAQQDVL